MCMYLKFFLFPQLPCICANFKDSSNDICMVQTMHIHSVYKGYIMKPLRCFVGDLCFLNKLWLQHKIVVSQDIGLLHQNTNKFKKNEFQYPLRYIPCIYLLLVYTLYVHGIYRDMVYTMYNISTVPDVNMHSGWQPASENNHMHWQNMQ